METLIKFDYWSRIVEVSSLAFFFSLETVLLLLIRNYIPSMNNSYYRLQAKYNIFKITALKIVMVSVISYAIITKQWVYGDFVYLILIYGTAVIILLVDFISQRRSQPKKDVRDLQAE